MSTSKSPDSVHHSAQSTAPKKPVPPAPNTVTITDDGFSPEEVTLKINDKVTFVNNGTKTHNVTFDAVPMMTEDIKAGDSFVHTVTAVGEHKYHDKADPEMKGVLKVA